MVVSLTAGLCILLAPAVCPAAGNEESEVTFSDEGGDLEDEFEFLQEDEVVESAARHKQAIGMSPSAITVITREDIEASGAHSLPELLRLVPGMHVIVSTPYFIVNTARHRFNTENHEYLWLIDGREANFELLGMTHWTIQPVSLQDIERIEVIRGPGSALYGANALAGVVSITTRAVTEETTGGFHLEGGDIGNLMAGAWASSRHGSWGFSASGGGEISGTWDDPRRLSKQTWRLRSLLEYRLSDDARLLLDAGFSHGSGFISTAVGYLDVDLSFQSLRLAYDSKGLKGQLYWVHSPTQIEVNTPLTWNGASLATVKPPYIDAHTLDGQLQWTVPGFWDPLLIIVGAMGRVSWAGSDQLLDGDSYTDPNSSRYREPGISHWQGRTGGFVHAEISPADWVTVSGALRVDYNTVSGEFVSPRLTGVFRPWESQFFRVGVSRAFRKPAFFESHLHVMAEFPADSLFQGADQQAFQDFMSRAVGHPGLENEKLLAFEAGYQGRFLEGKIQVGLELYYYRYSDRLGFRDKVELTPQGLPDLVNSQVHILNKPDSDQDIAGCELSVRYALNQNLFLQAWWAHIEVIRQMDRVVSDNTPKNLMALGGRFKTDGGLIGSLYFFTRSEFIDGGVPNPEGFLQKKTRQQLDNVLIISSRVGWRITFHERFQAEAGIKLLLPISPWSDSLYTYQGEGGGITADGDRYGGDAVGRVVSVYLQGMF
jgi:outer membrane receptor for ferrienterochelin and colicin